MSQFGTPSGADAPSITVARAKVVFEPDQDSLDESLREVEKKYQEVIDRVKAAAKQAIEEVAADTAQLIDDLKGKLDAVSAAQATATTPQGETQDDDGSDPLLLKLTEIAVTVVRIESNTDGILANTQAMAEGP